ncbi:MAG: PEP-CTERM sorting domain-containing protein, partial [Planctomycetota bacterium]
MIRSSLVARWALGLLVLLAGSASLPAVDLYVTGFDFNTQKNIFGKIDSATLVYSQLNSDIGGGFNTKGLAWNPNISQFNMLRDDGTFSTITTTGTMGSVASGLTNGSLSYNSASSTMYSVNGSALNTVNPATGAQSNIGNPGASSVWGSAFVNGTMYGTAGIYSSGPMLDRFYGRFNLSTGAFTAITASNDFTYGNMALAYDGTTLFGIKSTSLYSLNPTTGAYTGLGTVTGIANGQFYAMSVPVAVPEPSTYALAAIATGVMAAIARRRKARR